MVSQRSRGAMFVALFVGLSVALLALQKGHVDSAPSFDGADLKRTTPATRSDQLPPSTNAIVKRTPHASAADPAPPSAPATETPSAAAAGASLDGPLKLRLPNAPIFRDYPAYVWPLRENMTSEVVTRSTLVTAPGSFVGSVLPRPRRVDLDYPCQLEHDPSQAREFSGRPPVQLYVSWPSPKSNTQVPLGVAKCPVQCRVTSEASAIPDVDGFVVDSNGALINEKYDWPRNPLRKRLVFFNTENVEGRRSVLKRGYGLRYLAKPYNHTLWEQFHLVVSYHWHSPVRLSFAEWASCRVDDLSKTTALLRSSGATTTAGGVKKDGSLAPVLFFARNCDFVMHKRQGFVRKLREYISVDAVGKCLNSREQTSIQRCQRGALNALKNKRPCIISQYRFYLAVENSISLDYVTEKVYEPLLMGTIPVYLGAPNVVNFLPAAHSAIIAADFASMAELARYLKCVMRNETLYSYYTAWRERPRLAPFDALQRQYAPLCQVCMAIDRDKRRVSEPPRVGSARPPTSDGSLASLMESQAPLWNSCPTTVGKG